MLPKLPLAQGSKQTRDILDGCCFWNNPAVIQKPWSVSPAGDVEVSSLKAETRVVEVSRLSPSHFSFLQLYISVVTLYRASVASTVSLKRASVAGGTAKTSKSLQHPA